MKLERWSRRAARPWLLLRPGTHGEAWQWARIEQGHVQASGSGTPPPIAGAWVALVLPGELCSHFQVPAPPGLKRHEWPLLLEDRLLQSAQTMACGCLGRAPGSMQLVCVDQALLDGWLDQCAAWQIDVQRCWAEFQLLPAPSPGTAWCWQRDARLSLFVGRSAEARQHWLAWPVELQAMAPAGVWSELEMQALEGAWPEHFTALDGLPSLFERRRPKRQVRQMSPGLWRLPAACLALAVLWVGLWSSQQWRQQGMYRAQVEDVVGPVASVREAAQRVKQQRLGADERQLRLRQLEHLQNELDGWLRANGSWQLSAAHFDGQRWTLRLRGHEVIDDSPWQAMASAIGVAVQVTEASDELNLTFDLGGRIMRLNLEHRGVRLLAVAIIAVLLVLLAWREGQQRWQAFGQWQVLAQSVLALRAEKTLTADDLQQAAKAREINIENLEPGSEEWLVRGRLKDERVLQDWLQQLEREGARPLRWGLRRDESALHFELALQR